MNEQNSFDTVLELKLSGAFAHFRKFYTNASSLTYSIPPRTGVCGILASILKLPRDSYYHILSSDHLGVAISIWEDSGLRKQFFTTNYVGDDKDINNVSGHKQCRLELMLPKPGKELAWKILIGFKAGSEPLLDSLEQLIAAQNLGYGVYLGQRQFSGNLELLRKYSTHEIRFLPESDYVDTVIAKDKTLTLGNNEFRLTMERMPLDQTLETAGKKSFRRSIRFADVLIEITGKRLTGKFMDIIELESERKTRIAFL